MEDIYDEAAGPSKNNHIHPSTQLCKEEECDGFDFNMGDNWIYPVNKPLRSYQYDIIKKCLYNNTLVVLPTGLGKTFIAAVIIYNYYRWYPRGKIIFVAPTKPLVFQQKSACFDIMGISDEDTVEITGQFSVNKRMQLWRSKRLIFATPQVVENDLNESQFPFSSIKLLVFDEAHKAKGKYSYCEIVRKLNQLNQYFRVVALSATPGENISDVVEVVNNLLISHIDLRHIDSPDLTEYIHKTNIVSEVVVLCENLEIFKKNFLNIIRPYVDNLKKANVLVGTTETLSKNWLIMQHKKIRENSRSHPNYREINADFTLSTTLFHGLELLVRNGLKSFINFFMEDNQRTFYCFNRDAKFTAFLDDVKQLVNKKGETYFGHPKFDILRKTLLCHFLNDKDSRAIVFSEYRFCVSLILNSLQNCSLIKPKILVGQSNSTQKTQKETLNDFKAGICNVLISTSVGEEGLDIGEVDLIVCFDTNSKSSVRFLQRIGRTGRKRSGKVVMLVTKGKEENNLQEVLKNKNKTNSLILNSESINENLFQHSHRLVPKQFNPECFYAYMKPVMDTSRPSTSSKIDRKNTKNINSYFNKIIKTTIPDNVEISPNEASIVISDDEDDFEPKTINKKDESLNDKIVLFERRLKENKFFSSFVKDGKKNLNHCTERLALIDVTNLIKNVTEIRKDVKMLKDEQQEKFVSRVPQVINDDDNRFSENISSSFLKTETNNSTNKINLSQLSTWSSPDRFDLNVNTVDDLFEESWESQGNLRQLEHWKNSSTTDNLDQKIENKDDISDILSQSVLKFATENLEVAENNSDNEDMACHESPDISQSIFDFKRCRRHSEKTRNDNSVQSSTETSKEAEENISTADELIDDTQLLHESYLSVNDTEIIECSQKFVETKRPRLRRLLCGNNKKSPEECCSKINNIENLMSSSLKNDSEIVPEKESNENTLIETVEEQITNQQRKRIYKKNCFINDEAIDDLEDPNEETEINDSHLPDDSVIDHSFDESAVYNSNVDMQKIYLESVKYPINNHGFKIPEKRTTNMPNVFSQIVLPDDSILDESFINESVQLNDEEDEIDRAEAILKERSKKRKRRLVESETLVVEVVKKRRYYIESSDSSQDG